MSTVLAHTLRRKNLVILRSRVLYHVPRLLVRILLIANGSGGARDGPLGCIRVACETEKAKKGEGDYTEGGEGDTTLSQVESFHGLQLGRERPELFERP